MEGGVHCVPCHLHSSREMYNWEKGPPRLGSGLQDRNKRIERARSAREILVYIYNRGGGSRFQGARPVPPSVEQGLRIEVRTFMPLQMVSRALLKRFWLPKWVPNRGPDGVQTRFLMHISDRSRKRRPLQGLFMHYQHCEDAI